MSGAVHYSTTVAAAAISPEAPLTATITIDAPAHRNALSADLLQQLSQLLSTAEADPAVRSIVLTHTGPVFCSGMDLTATVTAAEHDATASKTAADSSPLVAFPRLLQQIWRSPKPVIARVDGKARAGGIGLIAACDIAIASRRADFAFTEVRLGLVPALISVALAPRLDLRQLHELLLTGETFDAARAESIGLLNRVSAELDREVARYAAMFDSCEPRALAETKKLLNARDDGTSMAAAYQAMGELSAQFFGSPEAREGIAAFAAKRPPSWATKTPISAALETTPSEE